jgi:hypothetical protein
MRLSLVFILAVATATNTLAQCEEAGEVLPALNGEVYLTCSEESRAATRIQTGEPLAKIRVRKSALMAGSDRRKRELIRGVFRDIQFSAPPFKDWLSPRLGR